MNAWELMQLLRATKHDEKVLMETAKGEPVEVQSVTVRPDGSVVLVPKTDVAKAE